MKELHWLPVKYRIQYKLATLAFRHFDSTLPPYLSSSLCTYQPSRFLCSSTERLLKIPKTNPKTFGECSFGYIAPTVWNSLPADLRASPSLPTFKVNLKMHFFHQAFRLICTCQPLPVSYSCVCVCVCVHVSWGRGWGLGEMELRVGSNIRFNFFIYCCFSYGTCTCILYIVRCHNHMYYVCET